jgi:hypothetical protein
LALLAYSTKDKINEQDKFKIFAAILFCLAAYLGNYT